ncbi:hypothetical protein ACFY5K_15125 [Streptomyces griseofuscus]|uniref:hypothetical protein n=1 Tax=Streptomyces TaxID=1883 RepID=UPI00081F0C14|nr:MULTISPECIES: hypothetical protein [unclassified Streptomyces]MYQ90400.1 hypothetical protein [Streptomyces sp. SID4946]SCF59998.1 hypothetical protein GA0115256_104614 [Streptomyces sp. DconLS]SCG05925.1 hypothetical protein GA0115258_129723 [Streptomyces sp. LamerLS-31b]
MRRIAAVLLAASAGAAALATPAVADSNAPYARGAAVVNSDGSLDSGKHVAGTRKVNVGRYCVTFDDTIERADAIAVTQPHDWRRVIVLRNGGASCNGPHDFYVAMDNRSGDYEDGSFTLAVL